MGLPTCDIVKSWCEISVISWKYLIYLWSDLKIEKRLTELNVRDVKTGKYRQVLVFKGTSVFS